VGSSRLVLPGPPERESCVMISLRGIAAHAIEGCGPFAGAPSGMAHTQGQAPFKLSAGPGRIKPQQSLMPAAQDINLPARSA